MFSFLNPYVIGGAILAAVLLTTGGYVKGRMDGRAIEQAALVKQINQENTNAGNAAEKWRADFRRCVDAGRVYDFETGACNG